MEKHGLGIGGGLRSENELISTLSFDYGLLRPIRRLFDGLPVAAIFCAERYGCT
jgi:hypothetical protein